ncbi:DNA-binding protein [Microbacterium laevaniformans]|uniref:YobI family P-loop NTPase n=1 Tax=Microbacterium laevaniformans TaxID=36807 RepID=UPI00363D9FF4
MDSQENNATDVSDDADRLDVGVEARLLEEWDLVALTPTFMEAEHAQYAIAIVKALDDPLIRNIALSGNYGVGKSSILQEVSRLKGEEVVELSLSTLAPIEQGALDDSVPRQATTPTNRIQQEIVKQLLYREEPDNAAGSRFRRIERFNPWREVALAGLVGLVITLIFLIAGWGATISKTLEPLGDIGLWVYPGVFLVAGGAAYLARWLLHGRVHIKQFSAGPAAVTLDEKSVSYFDQYLDEIVYFFETSKHRIVIFEDIDRFNDSHIFETLRSLNTLLNAAPQIDNRPVRFIYAIKDSIFDRTGLEKEGRKADETLADLTDPAQAESVRANRTKFFDLVIPVVPFITHRSARNLTTQILRGIEHKVSDDLIDLAGRFVPDMRLLKNVRNEFVVFRDRIFSGDGEQLELSETELFAMMLYKSTHLSDFEAIRLGKSKLDRLYELTRALVGVNVDRLERELRAARRELTRAGSAVAQAPRLGERLIESVRVTIRAAGFQTANGSYQYAGSVRNQDYFRSAEFWKSLAEGDGSTTLFWQNPFHGGQVSLGRTDIEALLGEKLDAAAWKEADRNAANERIAELQEQLRFLRSADMGDLIKRPEFVVDFEEERISLAAVAERLLTRGLAFELVKAGHIDRNFTLYTSTFHGDRVSPAATNFIIHHVERGLIDEHFRLRPADVDAVIRERGEQSLSDPSLYNVAILDHLLSAKNPSAGIMITALARFDTEGIRFLRSYLSGGAYADQLIARLTMLSPRVLTHLVGEAELDDDARSILVSACLASLSDRLKQRVDDEAKKYLLVNYAELPALKSVELTVRAANRLASLFDEAGIVLPDLTPLSDRVRSAFVAFGNYEVNVANLKAALGDDVGLALDEIRAASPDNVYARVLADLPDYLAAIDGHSPSNATAAGFAAVITAVHDEEPTFLRQVIAAASPESRITNLNDVPEDAWAPLAQESRFPASFANVTAYVARAGGVDGALAAVLESDQAISELGNAEQNDRRDLAVTIIGAASVLGPVLRAKLSKSLQLKYYIAIASIPVEDGVLIPELISRNVVQGNAAAYGHVSGLKWATKEAVLRASPTFADWVTPELVGGDLGQVLATTAVRDEAKRAIAERADEYAPLGGRLGMSELARIAVAMNVTVSFPVVEMMATNRVTAQLVLTLLRPYLSGASDAQLFGVLRAVGGDYAQLTTVGRDKPKIPNSAASIALLEALKPRGIVASFDPMQDPIKVSKRHK